MRNNSIDLFHQRNHEKKELKKHISAIHCSNTLSLMQRKIANVLLYHAYAHLVDREEHKISIRELCQYLEYKGGNYGFIKENLKTLVATVMEWNVIDDQTGEEDWTASSMLASVRLKGSVCTYAYSPRMRNLFHSPSMYGRINILLQARFTSSYGLALYESCVRYKGLPQTKEFPLDMFRKMMGVPPEKYQIFRDFKRRVLNKAVEEINAISEILVDPIIKRAGKKVVSIQFNLKPRRKKKFLAHPGEEPASLKARSEEEEQTLSKLVHVYKLSHAKAHEVIEEYGVEKIEEIMTQIESSHAFVAGKIHNVAGFLIKALQQDYQLSPSSAVLINRISAEQEEQAREDKKIEEEERRVLAEYHAYLNNQFVQKIESLESSELAALVADFEEKVMHRNAPMLRQYQEQGWRTPMFIGTFKQFVAKNKPELMPNEITLDAFLNQAE